MTSPRNSFLAAVDAVRAVNGPAALDLRPTQVAIVTRTWSGPRRGTGTYTETSLALPAYTKVRHVTTREVAQSGGRYEQDDAVIGPITPQYTNPATGAVGGFTEAQLVPTASEGIEIIYRLSLAPGASGISGDAYLVQFKRDRALHFTLIVGRLRTTPGF